MKTLNQFLEQGQPAEDPKKEDPKVKQAQAKENMLKKRVLMTKIRAVRGLQKVSWHHMNQKVRW